MSETEFNLISNLFGWKLNFRLEKGVIVYICDSRGIRDIYETDGSDAIAVSEPLTVLVF